MLQPETAHDDGPSKNAVTSFLANFVANFAGNTTGSNSAKKPAGALARKAPKPSGYKKYTAAEVAAHNEPEDCWMIIENKVYDVSAMAHPGGSVVFSYAGRDATEAFAVLHKDQARVRAVLKAYLIGELSASTPTQTPLLEDWNQMVKRFSEQGLMTASAVYYVRKIVELLAQAGTALYLMYQFPTNTAMLVLASVLLGSFMLQCGWAQHDFLHNAVFGTHKLNRIVGGMVISIGIGGSSHWWKTKHNQHHATPNKMSADDTEAVDPDIDTVPLIAWSESLLRKVNVPDRGVIMVQHVVVWPLMLVALINWQVQSVIHLFVHPDVTPKIRRQELSMIALHYAWTLGSTFSLLSFSNGLLVWLLSHAIAGFAIAFVFIQSHNAMEIYNDDKDFVTSQMVSTRNINPGLITDWIFGGLNYQIEHHLFPTMPRHNFSAVRKDVMQFCARHGLPYESCGVWESTGKVYAQLAKIARVA